MGAGSIRALLAFSFRDWMAVAQGVMITAALLGLVLRLAVAELRRHTGNWVGAMIFVLIFGLGLMAPVNHLLDAQPRTVTGTVTEYSSGAYRSPADYTVLLENGDEIQMMANDGLFPRAYRAGDRIELEYHEGGLGIGYYCWPDET